MKKPYIQPDLDWKVILASETISASTGDNDVDVDSAWGDF